jgi:LEA14-like dessication related protein
MLGEEIQPDCERLSKKWSDTETEDKSLVYVLNIYNVNNGSYNC